MDNLFVCSGWGARNLRAEIIPTESDLGPTSGPLRERLSPALPPQAPPHRRKLLLPPAWRGCLQRLLRSNLPGVRLPTQILLLAGAFAGATLVAELGGAANLGTALTFGQIGFTIALVAVLVRA